jgi:WD40 repeat protein
MGVILSPYLMIRPFESGIPRLGAVVGEPLKGCVLSAAYSPDGQHNTSRSGDCTIRIWDADIGAAVVSLSRGT